MRKEMNFTKNSIQNLTVENTPYICYDTNESKLYVRVSNTGLKTFYIQIRFGYSVERIKLGCFPDLSVENARRKAKIIKAEVANGNDPLTGKKKLKAEYTFQQMFDKFMNDYSKIEKKSWKYDEADINNHCQKFFNRKISTITKEEIQSLFNTLTQHNGKTCANRVLERIRAMYNKMIFWGWQGQNPTNGIKKHHLEARQRFLQPFEIQMFFDELEKCNLDFQDAVKLALYTGLRKSNLFSLTWDAVNFQMNNLYIPAFNSKNGEVMNIPLPDKAKEVLQERYKRVAKTSNFVFPSAKSKSGHIIDYGNYWDAFRNKINLQNFHWHDMRTTLASYQASNQQSLLIIAKSLGHKDCQSTKRYAYLINEPIQQSMNDAIETLLASKENIQNERNSTTGIM